MGKLCVGLFGTCGGSRWRDPFIDHYDHHGIKYFNPQLPPGQWKPELAEVEADHLANDEVILFPVTGEKYGMGSLAESGFSIAQSLRLDDRRHFAILIAQTLDPSLNDPQMVQESLRARALVKQHLRKLRLPNVYIVDTMEELFRVSIVLYNAAATLDTLRSFNPQNRP